MASKKSIRRKDNWEILMREEVASLRENKFVYGKSDCCIFVGRIMKAMTGFDVIKDFRKFHKIKKYNADTFEKVLKKIGGLENECTRQWGEPLPVGKMRRGDLGLIRDETVGICDGDNMLSPDAEGGIKLTDRSECTMCWKIG